jgi:uncharacterized protein YuzE
MWYGEEMKIIIEKQFDTRADLDHYITTTFGENAERNKEVSLEIDADTQTKLQLDEETTVRGVKITTLKK